MKAPTRIKSEDDVVIVEAVRTPIGKRHGAMAGYHSADLLGVVQREVLARSGADPKTVDQVLGGCVSQVGQQSFNVTRTAWLSSGLPFTTPATTVDSACGSSQQASTLAIGLLASGLIEVAVSCGVEVMSRVPLNSSLSEGVGVQIPSSYEAHYQYANQFEAAERIATEFGITRNDTDALGFESQRRAAHAWSEGRFDSQIVTLEAPDIDESGALTGGTHLVERDECLRPTTLEGLAKLKPVARDNGIHTAGTSSQLADAASALLLTRRLVAQNLGLRPRARILDTCLVGSDPELMLTGPITATQLLLERNGMSIDDIDLIEMNEAFASVVLAWERVVLPDREKVNPNGGSIALGHALGSTGCVLLAKALHELERMDGYLALVTMCCGGGMATGTLLERL